MINIGKKSVELEDITSKVSDFDILKHYFGITQIPCLILSPFRADNNPSFGLYSKDGKSILWKDFATKEGGDVISLMMKYWGKNYMDTINTLYEELPNFTNINKTITKTKSSPRIKKSGNTILECKVREWKDYDLEYWNTYGINLKWLKYADVYPISHKIIIKDNQRFVFKADKYAYAYVEYKEGKVTLKIYQPFNKKGYKWANNHDKSVISLWTKIPKNGDKVCICASLKDALCLWANTNIPALAIQGEGYKMSNTAINELKSRYKEIYILLDNDEAGLKDGLSLSEFTGFINVVLPKYEELGNPKDISDFYKSLNNKDLFKLEVLKLFK